MKPLAWGFVAASWVAMGLVSMATQENRLTSTGLFPVYDSSGETHGEDLAGNLTPAIYEALKRSGRELVLLNPGGSYSLLDEAASLEYARSAGVQVVLVPKFAPTQRSKPTDNSPRLRVELRAIEVASGKTLQSFALTKEVKRKDLERGFDQGYLVRSRKVEKQELGKILKTIAEEIRDSILGFKGAAVVYPSAALHPGPFPPSCAVEFSIRYTRQRSASKAYELYVNDRDESTGIKDDGTTAIALKPGLNLFYVIVKDPPYRLAVQKNYSINRWMDCSADERHLVMEIGGAGDALIVARP
jgi:hypothetical protein